MKQQQAEERHLKISDFMSSPVVTARPDRVSQLVDLLQKNGYLEAVQTANTTYYQMT